MERNLGHGEDSEVVVHPATLLVPRSHHVRCTQNRPGPRAAWQYEQVGDGIAWTGHGCRGVLTTKGCGKLAPVGVVLLTLSAVTEWRVPLRLACDNILSGYLCAVTTVFSQQDGIYGFKFPERFLEISFRYLTLFSLLLN